MNISTRSKAFRFGVIVGLALFAILNIWVYIISLRNGQRIGFPLPIYVEQYLDSIDLNNPEASLFVYRFPENIPANILLIFFSSLGIGLSAEVVTNTVKRKKADTNLQ